MLIELPYTDIAQRRRCRAFARQKLVVQLLKLYNYMCIADTNNMYKLVIIDNSKYAVDKIRELLHGQPSYEIIGEASCGISGLELLRQERPHLVLLETQLLGISGLEILEVIAQEKIPTLAIIVSNTAEFAYAQKAMFHNAIGYCLKPFSKVDISEYLEKAKSILSKIGSSNWPSTTYQTGNEIVDKMLDYIHQHFQSDISVQELAALCHINYNYAGQLFRNETGETISSYIVRVRMEKASELLRKTTLPIADVAAQAGYQDYFYFAKIFKKYWEITPSVFRQENGVVADDKN